MTIINTFCHYLNSCILPQRPRAVVSDSLQDRWEEQRFHSFLVCGSVWETGRWLRWWNTQLSQTGSTHKWPKLVCNASINSHRLPQRHNHTCVSTPSRISIRKKQKVQNWGNGIRAAAWGYAMNAKPGPLLVEVREHFRFKFQLEKENANDDQECYSDKIWMFEKVQSVLITVFWWWDIPYLIYF